MHDYKVIKMVHNKKPIGNDSKLHRKKFTVDGVMYARKIARDANILSPTEGAGKNKQIDSIEFENNYYFF